MCFAPGREEPLVLPGRDRKWLDEHDAAGAVGVAVLVGDLVARTGCDDDEPVPDVRAERAVQAGAFERRRLVLVELDHHACKVNRTSSDEFRRAPRSYLTDPNTGDHP